MTVRKKRERKASFPCTVKDCVEFVMRNIPHAAHSQPGSEGQRTDETERNLAPVGMRRYAAPHRSMKTLGWRRKRFRSLCTMKLTHVWSVNASLDSD